MSTALITELIEAGVRFGHQTQPATVRPAKIPVANGKVLSPEEAALWDTINRTLSPASLNAYHRLRLKAEKENLTDLEQEELVRLTDEAEILHSDRIKAVISLAALRGEKTSSLMDSAGI